MGNKIGDILYYDCIGMIIDPIDIKEQAEKLLHFLEENKDDSEIMRVTYLLRNNHKIIGN